MNTIQFHEAGEWWVYDELEEFDTALMIASALCEYHHEDSVRIVTPEGEII